MSVPMRSRRWIGPGLIVLVLLSLVLMGIINGQSHSQSTTTNVPAHLTATTTSGETVTLALPATSPGRHPVTLTLTPPASPAARVVLDCTMLDMPMPVQTIALQTRDSQTLTGTVDFLMPGTWQCTVSLIAPDGSAPTQHLIFMVHTTT